MIRDFLRAAILVVAFLVLLAEIQGHDEAVLEQHFSTIKDPK